MGLRLEEARRDFYRRKAKEEGYPSRSAYKILQLHYKYGLFRRGQKVLDLGSAPGGWLMVASRLVGAEGRVVGLDLKPFKLSAKNVSILVGDIYEEGMETRLLGLLKGRADLLLSDLAPQLSGIWELDQAKQLDMSRRVLRLLPQLLNKGGSAVLKLFQGDMTGEVIEEASGLFEKIKVEKPPASRKESSELYLVCLGYRADQGPKPPSAGAS